MATIKWTEEDKIFVLKMANQGIGYERQSKLLGKGSKKTLRAFAKSLGIDTSMNRRVATEEEKTVKALCDIPMVKIMPLSFESLIVSQAPVGRSHRQNDAFSTALRERALAQGLNVTVVKCVW